MKKFLFFGYRSWATNIFSNVSNDEDEYTFVNNNSLCSIEFIDQIKPDVIFFYGWSWYVKKEITDKYLCLCLHPSKLPEFRGGSPIQNQIMAGIKNSAVTIFKMGTGIDDGEIYIQLSLDLSGYINDIYKRMEIMGTHGTKAFIKDYKNNSVVWIAQNEKQSTTYKRLKPSDSEILPEDFKKNSAEYFYNKIRGLQSPYPEAFIKCKSGKLIFEKVRYEEDI